jgi:uncharacterized protein YuzE
MEQSVEATQRRQLQMSYDKEADVLYVSFGAPQAAISEETSEGILLRKDPETGAIVGVTVLDFEKRFASGSATTLPVLLERVSAA